MRRATWRSIFVVSACLGAAQHATGGERPAVVELFTSQGCSSCPPADALVGALAQERPDLILLSMPVDIWDYVGWKDTLAKPEFSARQKHYSQTRGDHQVYTPQAVVDGSVHLVGSDRPHLLAAVDDTAATRRGAATPSLTLSEKGGMVVAEIGASGADLGRGAGVWLLRVVKNRTVHIGRGENSGRQVTYTNVVRSIARMGHWTGAPARFEMPAPEARSDEADGYVVLVQKGWGDSLGPIIAAAKSGDL